MTHTLLNVHVRDNFNAVCTAAFSAKGDGFFATGANAGARVPISSSNGGILIQNSACNAGVCWDAHFAISASNPTITNACAPQLIINTTSAGNNAGYLIFKDNGTTMYQVQTDIEGNGQTNFAIYDAINSTTRFEITASGQVLIGTSTCSSKTNRQGGLVISACGGLETISSKQLGYAHGMTNVTETDTFMFAGHTPTSPGTSLAGATLEGFSTSSNGMVIFGHVTTEVSARSTSADGAVSIRCDTKVGTATNNMSSNQNMMVIRNNSNTAFIFDSDGDMHADAAITASAYDAYNDAHLIRALELERNPGGIIRTEFDGWLKHNRADLEKAKIATFNDRGSGDGSGGVFVNYTGLARLHSGAIWQLYTELQTVKAKLSELSPPTDTARELPSIAAQP